jgi:hypothetical protein
MRTILVHAEETFQIEIPDDAELTFGPWSPPGEKRSGEPWSSEQRRGTLRVYAPKKAEIWAVFSGVRDFRDISKVSYRKEVVQVKGETTTVWERDDGRYETSTSRKEQEKRQWLPELTENTE